MRRHLTSDDTLVGVTLTRSEWAAVAAAFKAGSEGDNPRLRTWCPARGAVTVSARIVADGDPAAQPMFRPVPNTNVPVIEPGAPEVRMRRRGTMRIARAEAMGVARPEAEPDAV